MNPSSATAAAYRRAFGIPNTDTTTITHASHSQRQRPTYFVGTVLDTNIGHTPHVPHHQHQHHGQQSRQHEHEQLRQPRQRQQHQSSSSSSNSSESPSPLSLIPPFGQAGAEFYQQHAQAQAQAQAQSYSLVPARWQGEAQDHQRLYSHAPLSLQQEEAYQRQFERQQLFQAQQSPYTAPHDIHTPSNTGKNPSAPPAPPLLNSSSSRPSSLYSASASTSQHGQPYARPSASASLQGLAMAPPGAPRSSSSKSNGLTHSPSPLRQQHDSQQRNSQPQHINPIPAQKHASSSSSSSNFPISHPNQQQGTVSVSVPVVARNIQTQMLPHTEHQRLKKAAAEQEQKTTPTTMITTEELQAHWQAHQRHQHRIQLRAEQQLQAQKQLQAEPEQHQALPALPLPVPLPQPQIPPQSGPDYPVQAPLGQIFSSSAIPPIPPTFGSVAPPVTPSASASATVTPPPPAPATTNPDRLISASADEALLPLRLGIESLLGDTANRVQGAMEKMHGEFIKQAASVRLKVREAVEEKERAVKEWGRERKERELAVAELRREREERASEIKRGEGEKKSEEAVLEKATQGFERERAVCKQREKFLMGLFPGWQREKVEEMLKEWEGGEGDTGDHAMVVEGSGDENKVEGNVNENEALRGENEKLKKENAELKMRLGKVAGFFVAYKDDFMLAIEERNRREKERPEPTLAIDVSSSSQGQGREVAVREPLCIRASSGPHRARDHNDSGRATPTQEEVMGYMATVLDAVGEKVTRQVDSRLEVILKEIEEQKMLREKAERERDELKAAHASASSHQKRNDANPPPTSSSSTLLESITSSRSSTPTPTSSTGQGYPLHYSAPGPSFSGTRLTIVASPDSDSRRTSSLSSPPPPSPPPSSASASASEAVGPGPGVDVDVIDLCSSPVPVPVSVEENVTTNTTEVAVDVKREAEQEVEQEIEQEEEEYWLERSFNSNRSRRDIPATENGSQSQSQTGGMDEEEEGEEMDTQTEMDVKIKPEPDVKIEEMKPDVNIDLGRATSTAGNNTNDTLSSSSRTAIPPPRAYSQPPPLLSLPTPAADPASDRVPSPSPSASSSPPPSPSITTLTSDPGSARKRTRGECELDSSDRAQDKGGKRPGPAMRVKIERVDDEDACNVQLDGQKSSSSAVTRRSMPISTSHMSNSNSNSNHDSNSSLPDSAFCSSIARPEPRPPMTIRKSVSNLEEGEMTPTPAPTSAPAPIRALVSNLEEGEMTPTPTPTPAPAPLSITLPARSAPAPRPEPANDRRTAPMPVALAGGDKSRAVGPVSPMRVSPMRPKTRSIFRSHTRALSAVTKTGPPHSTSAVTVNSESGSRAPEREVRKRKMVNHGGPAPITANQVPPAKKVKHSYIYEPIA